MVRMEQARIRDAKQVQEGLARLLATAERQTRDRDCTPSRRRLCTPSRNRVDRDCTPSRNRRDCTPSRRRVGQVSEEEAEAQQSEATGNRTTNEKRIHNQ